MACGDYEMKFFSLILMCAASYAMREHALFFDNKLFEKHFCRDLTNSVTRPNDHAGIFFTLMGYLSTLRKTVIKDQVAREPITISNVLYAIQNTDRFHVLIIAKTEFSQRLTGRLFYFYLNEDELQSHEFGKDDIDRIYDKLRTADPRMDESKLLQWIKQVESTCLCIKLKKSRLGETPNERLTDEGIVIDARFYIATNLFEKDVEGAAKFRELQLTNPFRHMQSKSLQETSKKLYHDLFKTFIMNFDSNFFSSFPQNMAAKSVLPVEVFLHFVRGALQYNLKMYRWAKITPIYVGSYLEKLAVLEYDPKNWVTSSRPIIIEAHHTFSDGKSSSDQLGYFQDLPIDYLTESEFLDLRAVIFPTATNEAQFLANEIKIKNKNDLLHILHKIAEINLDQFNANFWGIRRQIMLKLSKIDSFLGHEHRTDILRHFIFGTIMSAGGENPSYKLKDRFGESNPVDVFLVQSAESSGLLIVMSKTIPEQSLADELSDAVLKTGLKKIVVLTITDEPYEYLAKPDGTYSPHVDMMMVEEVKSGKFIHFDQSQWAYISPLFLHQCFSGMLINKVDQLLRTESLKTQLTMHSMVPESAFQYRAQIKGFVSETPIFTLDGYEHKFLGIRLNGNGPRDNSDMNRFDIPAEYGNSESPFHIIFHLVPKTEDIDLSELAAFFRSQLSLSGVSKLNTALIRSRLLYKDGYEEVKYEFHGSYPNGIDRQAYVGCLRRKGRAGAHDCQSAMEDEDEVENSYHDVLFKGKDTGAIRTGSFVNKAIYIQMFKGIVGAVIDRDFTRMAKESGVLALMLGVGMTGDAAIQWGTSLMKGGSFLKGGSTFVGGKFLSKAYLIFVVNDLIGRIKAHQMNDSDQIEGILGDAAILTVNVISESVSLYTTFVTAEEASVELGPEVMIAEAVIFAIVDGFYAVRSVQKLEEYVQLSWAEDVVQWTRSFFGASPSDYLENFKQQEYLLQKAMNESIGTLEKHKGSFTYYATPSLTLNEKGDIVQQENNSIDLNSRTQVLSRIWPKGEHDITIECASSGSEKQLSTIGFMRGISNKLRFTTDGALHNSYVCEHMVTLSVKDNKTDGLALIALGNGTDNAKGFMEMSNYFVLGGGQKQVVGGVLADTFQFVGNDTISGTIDGMNGSDTLDLSQYMISTQLLIDIANESLVHPTNVTTVVKSIEHLIGRKASAEVIICSCTTQYLDTKGGVSSMQPDKIIVPKLDCTSEMAVKLSGDIVVESMSMTIEQIYIVTDNTSASINNVDKYTEDVFLLPTNLSSFDSIEVMSSNNTISTILRNRLHNISIAVNRLQEKSYFVFNDGYQMTHSDGIFHARCEIQNFTLEDLLIREQLLAISNRLNITITLFSKTTNELMQVYNLKKSEQVENKVHVTHFSNDENYKSLIMTTNYGKNYFQIHGSCSQLLNNVKCWMKNLSVHIIDHDNNSNPNILDFSSINDLLLQYGQKLGINIRNFTNKVIIDLKGDQDVLGSIDIDYGLLIDQGGCTNILVNIRTLMHVCYDDRIARFVVYPIPLTVKNSKSILVLSKSDVEHNMVIQIDRKMPNFTCQSYNDSLILTNSNSEQDIPNQFTLIFIDYFPPSWTLLDDSVSQLFDSIVFEFGRDSKKEIVTIQVFIEKCGYLIEKL